MRHVWCCMFCQVHQQSGARHLETPGFPLMSMQINAARCVKDMSTIARYRYYVVRFMQRVHASSGVGIQVSEALPAWVDVSWKRTHKAGLPAVETAWAQEFPHLQNNLYDLYVSSWFFTLGKLEAYDFVWWRLWWCHSWEYSRIQLTDTSGIYWHDLVLKIYKLVCDSRLQSNFLRMETFSVCHNHLLRLRVPWEWQWMRQLMCQSFLSLCHVSLALFSVLSSMASMNSLRMKYPSK